jgi:cytochrome P450
MPLESFSDLYSSAFLADPYPILAALRRQAPVWWFAREHAFVVTRYDDAVAVLGDYERFADSTEDGAAVASLEGDHMQLRSAVLRAFGTGFIADLEPTVQCLVDGLIQPFAEAGEMDFSTVVANPLPTLVLAHILGVPVAEWRDFAGWAADHTAALVDTADEEVQARYRRSAHAVLAYFAQRLAFPDARDDLLSRLAQLHLSTAAMLLFCQLLMVAARDLTTGLLTNGLHALLRHPTQLARLRDEPGLMESAVEECLRWDAPVLAQARVCRRDTSIRGVSVPSGSRVLVMLGAANRDSRVFPDPDRFHIARPNASQHLAFGRGTRSCLGAPIARLEVRVALTAMLDRCPELSLVAPRPPRRRPSGSMLNLRSFVSLPISWRPA